MSGGDHTNLPLPQITPAPHILLVVAPYYRAVTDELVAGAVMVLEQAHVTHETVEVPGALEIPPAIRLASRARRFDGYVALGCVLRGETTHYDMICNDNSRGLMLLGLEALCIGNGILTCETMDQARVRAAPSGQDKGGGAAAAALHLIALTRRFGSTQEARSRCGTSRSGSPANSGAAASPISATGER